MDAVVWNAGERQPGGRKEVQQSINYILNTMQILEGGKKRFRTKQNTTE